MCRVLEISITESQQLHSGRNGGELITMAFWFSDWVIGLRKVGRGVEWSGDRRGVRSACELLYDPPDSRLIGGGDERGMELYVTQNRDLRQRLKVYYKWACALQLGSYAYFLHTTSPAVGWRSHTQFPCVVLISVMVADEPR